VTIGLKWNLDHQTLDQSFYSLSNVAVGDSFEVKVGSGALICVLQNA
jgi:thiamine pyrophosphokinase